MLNSHRTALRTTIVAAVVLAAGAYVALTPAVAATVRPVSLNRSCEKTAKTQLGLDDCAYSELAQVQPQLAAALVAETARFGKGVVDSSQSEWLKFRNAECRLEASTYAGGSIYPLIYVNCEVTLTVTRITEVRRVIADTPRG